MKTIYFNGNVYTGALPLSSAFAVEDGRFVFAGSNEDAKALATPEDSLVDLDGKFVCSGFNDSHMHLLNYGSSLLKAPLAAHTGSLTDMLQCLTDFLAAHPVTGNGWLSACGWNQDYFSDVHRLPDRYDLDKVSETVPICAVRACGHCLVVNSRALALLGVTADTPSPDGGQIGMENGEPDGRFYDNAMQMIYRAIPVPDKAAIKNMIRSACKALNSYGVTNSQTDDYCVYREVPWQTINEAYRELEASGELTVRVYEQSNFTELPALKEFVEAGNITGTGSDLFRIGPLKMLGDGALGARTAFLSRPYADDPSTYGIPVFSQETLDEMICYANEQGMQVAVHTIGDACLDRVLHAYEKALSEHPRDDHRHGIIHCQISRADQLETIARLNLHVYAQSIFLDYDNHIVEQRVGKDLASTSYSWKTLMKNGVSVSNGTDCPVELPDAMAGMQCAITRTTLRDHVGPYLPEQAFTVQEALDSYTIRGAEGSFEETKKGHIAPGMLADFVILGANPFEVDVETIKDIPICQTFLGGKKVFG
ncbi:MAG: amidohydrolase [Clostridiales bacterium]|nr:amidohydrolase [Clostridiales bacterium]